MSTHIKVCEEDDTPPLKFEDIFYVLVYIERCLASLLHFLIITTGSNKAAITLNETAIVLHLMFVCLFMYCYIP